MQQGPAGRTVEKAVLQLRSAGNGSGGTQNVKLVANDGWTEAGITCNNRPALGMHTTSSGGLDLNSRETGSTAAPKLVLTLKK